MFCPKKCVFGVQLAERCAISKIRFITPNPFFLFKIMSKYAVNNFCLRKTFKKCEIGTHLTQRAAWTELEKMFIFLFSRTFSWAFTDVFAKMYEIFIVVYLFHVGHLVVPSLRDPRQLSFVQLKTKLKHIII